MSDYDPTDFVDSDFQAREAPQSAVPASAVFPQRAPSREEVDAKVVEAQQKLAELKRAQEDLERERSALEETRRRQMEFQTGRQELTRDLTRGLGLLEEAEFNLRRDAEQMTRALSGFREALSKMEAIHEEAWTKEDFNVELTRALTVIENARMEWNSARLKFPLLSDSSLAEGGSVHAGAAPGLAPRLADMGFGQLCRLGLGLTWPVALAVLLALGVVAALLARR